MRVTVCRPQELGAAEQRRWRQLQATCPTFRHPFLSAEFARAVGLVSPRARVAVVEDGSEIVGFFPYDLGVLGVAKPLAGHFNYRQAFVHVPDLEWSWAELMGAGGIPAIEFSDLVAGQAIGPEELRTGVSPIIETSTSWETYLAGVKARKRIKTTLYSARKLEREIGDVEFTWSTTDTRDLAQLISWKSAQYRRSGWRDPFAQPWVRALLEVLTDGQRGDLQCVFGALRADGTLLAVELGLCFDTVLAGWQAAYNVEFARFSPGLIQMLRSIEHACDADISYIDLARGDETFKRSLKTSDLPVATGRVHQRSATASLYEAWRRPISEIESYILERPRLRQFVRSSLRTFGDARQAVSARVHPSER